MIIATLVKRFSILNLIRTDVIILIIPLTWFPMLRIPLWHKIAIGLLLCSGVFAIIAAIVRCILALRDIKSFNNTVMWAIREMVWRRSLLHNYPLLYS